MITRRTFSTYSQLQRLQTTSRHSIQYRVSPVASRSHSRTYSSAPTPASHKLQSSAEPPLPSTASTSSTRKRVDLHPSPRKTAQSPDLASGAPKIPAQPPNVESIASKPSTQTLIESSQAVKSKEADESGNDTHAIQLAIEDMRLAIKHGILKPPPEGAGSMRRLYHQAKELFKFYVRGIKLIFTHRKTVKDIKARVDAEKAAGRTARMTRWETQFIRTYQQDLRKLVPFMMIVLVIEEIIPLIVMYAPGLLPSTCIMPSQLDRIHAKAERTRKEALQSVRSMVDREAIPSPAEDINGIQPSVLKELCRAFGLSARGPASFTKRRLEQHLGYLSVDDELLIGEARGGRLTESELKDALRERGFLVEDVPEATMRSNLAGWLKSANGNERRVALVLERALKQAPSS